MSKKNFLDLLHRYFEGNCTDEECRVVEEWYELLDKKHVLPLEKENLRQLEDKLWDNIKPQLRQENKFRPLYRTLLAAASILLLVTLAAAFYQRVSLPDFASSQAPKGLQEISNNSTCFIKKVILPDGSTIQLSPGGNIKFPRDFNTGKREVKLVGDALFTVTADPKHPFFVFHRDMITKVLGTTFKIFAQKGNIEGQVIVYSGKVEVTKNASHTLVIQRIFSPAPRVSVTANKRAVLSKGSLFETLAPAPKPVNTFSAGLGRQTFNDIPLRDLAAHLGAIYGLNLLVEDDAAQALFTGNLENMDFFKQLNIICLVTDMEYKVSGTDIHIRKKGH